MVDDNQYGQAASAPIDATTKTWSLVRESVTLLTMIFPQTWTKRLVVSLILMLAIQSLAFLSLPRVVASGWFKARASAALSAALRRKVNFRGELKLVLGLSPTLIVSDFSIESPKTSQNGETPSPMLAIKHLLISAPLIRNLLGAYQIEQLHASDIQIALNSDVNGKSNWTFSTDTSDKGDGEATTSSFPAIKDFAIENLTVSLEGDGPARKFQFKRFSSPNLEFDTKGTLTSAFTADGMPIVASGTTSSLKAFLAGDPLDIKIDVRQGSNHLVASGALQQNGDLTLEVDASGEDLSTLSTLLRTRFPKWKNYQGKFRLTRTLEAREALKIEHLDVTLDGNHVLGDIELVFQSDDRTNVSLNLTSETHRIRADGFYKAGEQVDLKVQASGANLAQLSSLVLKKLPPWQDYSFDGRVKSSALTHGNFQLEHFKLQVGKQDLQGDLTFQANPIVVTAKLTSDSLDLSAITSTSGSETNPQNSEERRIPFDVFHAINADIDIHVADLTTFLGLEFANTHVTASLKDGALSVPKFSAEAFGGTVSGTLMAAHEKTHVTLDGENIASNPIALITGRTPIIEGNFMFSADLNSVGDSLSEVLRTLTGQISISSDDATLQSATLRSAGSSLYDILSPIFGESRHKKSECLLFNYDLRNGVAKSNGQVIKLGDVFIFGKGQLDFPNNTIDYNFNVNSRTPALASLIPPFRAFGSLDNPNFVPSVTGAIASAADAAEGIAESAVRLITGTADVLTGKRNKEVSGLEVCERAFRNEQGRISTRVGDAL